MIILSPCDRPEEVGPLLEAGAGELYGGVQPDDWAGLHLSANQRTFDSAQFASEAAFAEAVAAAEASGAAFHLVLNAPLYEPASYPKLVRLTERAAGWGTRGVIVGDLGLLLRLREARLPLEVTLSTMAGAVNAQTVAFFRTLGAGRVVLPRHLTLAEMGELVAANPEVAFEAFVLVGKCPNEEAWCSFQHVSTSRRWPCEIAYELSKADGAGVPAEHPLARWHGQWRTLDRRQACGLCGVRALERSGVRYLKLVGRGGPASAKVENVRLVARCVASHAGQTELLRSYEERFGRPCDPLVCYFPELHPFRHP